METLLRTPVIIINFKTYDKATGNKAVELAKICEKVAISTGKNIVLAVQSTDIKSVANAVSIPVLAQHIDPVNYGSHTGFVLPEAIKEAGAVGTLVNHSEHQVSKEIIDKIIWRAKEIGLIVVACANTPDKGAEIAPSLPHFIAIEPPELIGGTISVSSAKPELISESVSKINCPVLVGAGVKTGEDVKIGIKLGAKGILLASGITKANDPEKVLRDLVSVL